MNPRYLNDTDKRQEEYQARNFFQAETPNFIEAQSGWDKFKNFTRNNITGIGTLGAGLFGAGAAYIGNEYLHNTNQEDLIELQKSLKTNKEVFDNRNLSEIAKSDTHHALATHIDSSNDIIKKYVNDLQSVNYNDGNINPNDVKASKEELAELLWKKQENGKTMYETLDNDTKQVLTKAGIFKGYNDYLPIGRGSVQNPDILEDLEDNREKAVAKHLDFKNDPERIKELNREYVENQRKEFDTQQKNTAIDIKNTQNSINNHNDTVLRNTLIGGAAGSTLAFGGKKVYDFTKSRNPTPNHNQGHEDNSNQQPPTNR
jgi:hypothetical protein